MRKLYLPNIAFVFYAVGVLLFAEPRTPISIGLWLLAGLTVCVLVNLVIESLTNPREW